MPARLEAAASPQSDSKVAGLTAVKVAAASSWRDRERQTRPRFRRIWKLAGYSNKLGLWLIGRAVEITYNT